jgi:hypothetical protein
MTITKETLKANAATIFETLDEIETLHYSGTMPVLRYINRDRDQGICLEYDYMSKRIGAYRWKDGSATIDIDFKELNPPQELVDKLCALLERLYTQPEIVELLMEGEYNSYRDVFSYEIITDCRATEMYQDGYTASYELRVNRAGRVSQSGTRIAD